MDDTGTGIAALAVMVWLIAPRDPHMPLIVGRPGGCVPRRSPRVGAICSWRTRFPSLC